jgi:hypothetical protein
VRKKASLRRGSGILPLFLYLLVARLPILAYADTAISAPSEAKQVIANAKNDYRAGEQRQEAESYRAHLSTQAETALSEVEKAGELHAAAKSQLIKATEALTAAQVQSAAAKEELSLAQKRYEGDAAEGEKLLAELARAHERLGKITQELNEREAYLQELAEQSYRTGGNPPGAPEEHFLQWGRLRQAREEADLAAQHLRAFEESHLQLTALVTEKSEKAVAAQIACSQAEETIRWAREAEAGYAQYLAEAKERHAGAIKERESFFYRVQNPPVYSGFPTGIKYYNWRGQNGSSGQQFLLPLGIWSAWKNLSLGVATNYALGRAQNSYGSGSVAGMTDIYLYLGMRQNINKKFYLEYSFGLNLPTGKNALGTYQSNARMPGDLVELESYGGGWQYQPGLQINWLPYKYDKWTYGTSYNFSRYFDQTRDITNDATKPGREWNNFLRYQHAEEKWQLVAEIYSTSYKTSMFRNGFSYNTKNAWKYKITFNRKIAADQELMLYYWPQTQSKDNASFALSDASRTDFYGIMWSKHLGRDRTLRAAFDVMRTSGSRFGGIRGFYDSYGNPQSYYTQVMGRRKYTVGIGYDRRINSSLNLSFDLRCFWMKDGVSSLGEPATRYKGYSAVLLLTKSL